MPRLLIAIACACASKTSCALPGNAPVIWLLLISAFAAGAILMLLANTVMSEPFRHCGKLADVFTVIGFSLPVFMVLLERT